MDGGGTETIPLACVPGAIPEAERAGHFARMRRLFAGAAPPEEVPGGYGYHFAAGELLEVARFVDNERRCCPFLSFEVGVPADGGSLRLRITGPEGTRAFLDEELSTR